MSQATFEKAKRSGVTLSPGLRKSLLTLHITASVGWLGAVLVFVALALIGLTSRDTPTVRGVFLVMEPVAWYALLPLSLASFASGVLQALLSPWGLLRHYWILFKLMITVAATGILLSYMSTFGDMAMAASDPAVSIADLRPFANSVLLHGGLALIGLLLAAVLSVFKPRAVTGLGVSRQGRR